MDRIQEAKERAMQQAKEEREEDKRKRFCEVAKTFANRLRMLNILKCTKETSEKIEGDLFSYTLIVDRSVLKVPQNKESTEARWGFYRKSIGVINDALKAAVDRWDILRPFSFTVADINGQKVLGWMVDEAGTIHDTK